MCKQNRKVINFIKEVTAKQLLIFKQPEEISFSRNSLKDGENAILKKQERVKRK